MAMLMAWAVISTSGRSSPAQVTLQFYRPQQHVQIQPLFRVYDKR